MFSKLLSFCLLIGSFQLVLAQTSDTLFKSEWLAIDQQMNKEKLPKTALQKVDALYVKAKQINSKPQIIKTLIYKLSLEDVVFDDKPNNSIVQLENEISSTKDEATKSVLYSLLANRYLKYYNNYRWKIYNRTKTINYSSADIETWTADDFNETITKNYLLSAQNAQLLQSIQLVQFDAIIIKGNARNFRPTLYDLIMHEALDYFKTGNAYLTKPTFAFELNDINALLPTEQFTQYKFESKDSTAHQLITLQLYQKLITFHLNDNNKNALIHIDIDRLEWVNEHITHEAKEPAYIKALQQLANFSFDEAAQAAYLLAQQLHDKANTYKPFEDTTHRFANIEALSKIKQIQQKFNANALGVVNAKNLATTILNPSIQIEIEKVNVPNEPMRALVNYKNVDTLFVKIIKTLGEKNKNFDYNQSFKQFSALLPYKSFYQLLPQTNDYQQHAVEIKIDALPVGEYLLLTSNGKGFIDSINEMSYQFFHVSNISYIRNGTDYFVLNRNTGEPMNNVAVNAYTSVWNPQSNKYVYKLHASYKSNKNGWFTVSKSKLNGSFYFNFFTPTDSLNTNDYEYYYSYGNDTKSKKQKMSKKDIEEFEEEHSTIHYFTDRAIYRPGQTVFFKAILLTKDYTTNYSKLYNLKDSVDIYLEDVNGNTVDSITVLPNDYASINGSFKIPFNVLTGEFKITTFDVDEDRGKTIKVEEYKRPKFYVEFEKLKGTYKVNDSITITGFAKAYAGNTIDNATVNFTIQRKPRFIYDWYWRGVIRPRSNNQQISSGNIKTDASGKFSITFKALPDIAVDKNSDPLFDFEIQATVTDVNGETRSNKETVTVGYKSLTLQLNAPKLSSVTNKNEVTVFAKNLNGENQSANVQINIYEVETPKRLIRKRLWNKPDQFIFSKEQFVQLFPNDEYNDELNQDNWSAKQLHYNINLNTASQTSFQIPKEKNKSGYYKIEAITKDKEGNEVKDIKYMQLFSNESLSFPQYNFSYTINNYVQPSESAKFLMGSMATKIHVIQTIQEKNKTNSNYIFNTLEKGLHELNFKALEIHRGNIAIEQAFVINNRLYTNFFTIEVPWSNKQLQVALTSFRNKTEPGSKETYTVNITGNKNEKVAAELLTTMYDASLDQFAKHGFSTPNIWQNNSFRNNFSASNSFEKIISQNNYSRKINYIEVAAVVYDKLINNANEISRIQPLWWKNPNEYAYMKLDNRKNQVLAFASPAPEAASMLQGRVAGVQVLAEDSMDEVVVVGYGTAKKKAMTGSVATVQNETLSKEQAAVRIRGIASVKNENSLLVVVDGVVTELQFSNLNIDDIDHIDILKDASATALYGSRASSGALIVTTKNAAKKKQEQPIQPRKNFNETAFFFPNLYADTAGNYIFSFTIPEALTQWKWLSFAHTKDLAFGSNSATITTQKTLMVQPNAPRFLREGDNLEFVTKIANLSDKELTGQCTLELFDAITGASVDGWFQNSFPTQYFTAVANQSTVVKFPIQIPFNYNKPLTWRITAKAGAFGDGEENTLPVLTNRMLVTEALPLYLKSGEKEKSFSFDKLINTTSESLNHESITVEYTANPIWSVVQSLPYLMEYPYECAEQTFNRMYANTLASSIVNKHPKIKAVFEEWKKDSTDFKSNLQKSEELKQVLLQETPWVLNATAEQQRQKNIALLFDVVKMSSSINEVIEKLQQLQTSSGGFAWFKGGYESRYITNYILIGIGKLKKLNTLSKEQTAKLETIANNALVYLDEQLLKDYNQLKINKADLNKNNLSATQMQYLYMRSFYSNDLKNRDAYSYYYNLAKQYWNQQNTYNTALIGLVLYRNNERRFVNVNLMPSIIENAIEDTVKGTLFWKDRTACFWYASPIEHQSTMIEFLAEIAAKDNFVGLSQKIDAAKTWLILNKQTNSWQTTVATADACYVLLNTGSDWVNNSNQVQIKLGTQIINSQRATNNEKQQTNKGYIKQRIPGDKVNQAMGNITVSTSKPVNQLTSSPSYGAVYWQYFEDLDKITEASSPLSLKKKLFVEKHTATGKVLEPLNENEELKVGDKLVVRIVLSSDRTMEYLHLKDMRASGTEPVNVLSTYKWQGGLGYYEATKDASTNFFIDRLEKGTYVFEYPLYVTHTGIFSVGIATIQCMYAPEFTSHSEGIKISVKE